jgi:hypothetical protein
VKKKEMSYSSSSSSVVRSPKRKQPDTQNETEPVDSRRKLDNEAILLGPKFFPTLSEFINLSTNPDVKFDLEPKSGQLNKRINQSTQSSADLILLTTKYAQNWVQLQDNYGKWMIIHDNILSLCAIAITPILEKGDLSPNKRTRLESLRQALLLNAYMMIRKHIRSNRLLNVSCIPIVQSIGSQGNYRMWHFYIIPLYYEYPKQKKYIPFDQTLDRNPDMIRGFKYVSKYVSQHYNELYSNICDIMQTYHRTNYEIQATQTQPEPLPTPPPFPLSDSHGESGGGGGGGSKEGYPIEPRQPTSIEQEYGEYEDEEDEDNEGERERIGTEHSPENPQFQIQNIIPLHQNDRGYFDRTDDEQRPKFKAIHTDQIEEMLRGPGLWKAVF